MPSRLFRQRLAARRNAHLLHSPLQADEQSLPAKGVDRGPQPFSPANWPLPWGARGAMMPVHGPL
jgi:hypothetical protein